MQLMNKSESATMTSLEIAELTGARHDNVKVSIERLEKSGVISLPAMEEVKIQRERRAESASVYIFSGEKGKRDSIIVVAQLSPEFTARLVDRWQELESKQQEPAFAIPQTYAEALRLAAEQAEQLAIAAPKAQVYDRVIERGVLLTATQVGQKIGISAIILNRHLSELKVYNRAIKRGKVFQQWFIDKGFGEMKLTTEGHSQPLFTNAGEMWVIERLASEGIE